MDTKAFKKILIFAGTAEGRRLAEYLKEKRDVGIADFCVATEYGEESLREIEGISVISGRLNETEMRRLMAEKGYDHVIDATHPFAREATENIRAAALKSGVEYIRLIRGELPQTHDNIMIVESVEKAARYLDTVRDSFLLAIGAKELGAFKHVRGLSERGAVRVLPFKDSLERCIDAGFKSSRIIAMQGPFTREMNLATVRQYKIDVIVTKSTGKAGGFEEKTALADEGCKVIVIERPEKESGMSLGQVMEKLDEL